MTGIMHGDMWAWMLLWAVAGVVIVVAGVVTTVWMVRRASNAVDAPPGRPEVESPEDMLRRRYAAGEIDEDEYLKRISGLNQHG
ncbi:SHOCT domain-containing protein [Kribbella sancticallisti]